MQPVIKRAYQRPIIVPLGNRATGSGQCSNGSSNPEGYCLGGALNTATQCNIGFINVGDDCTMGQQDI